MPFKIITTVVHEGPPDLGEQLIVNTTVGRRVCVASKSRIGKVLMLHRDHWPKDVKDAASELLNELHRRGVAIALIEIDACIDPKRGLVEGKKIEVLIVCERHSRTKSVTLKGTITGFMTP